MKTESVMEKLKSSRQWSFVVITLIYVVATVLGVWVFLTLKESHFLLRLFAADFAAGAEYQSWQGILLPATGAMANTCLFVFISIPMMEKRQIANKPGYAAYRKNVRMLI